MYMLISGGRFGKVIRSRERMERLLSFHPNARWIVLRPGQDQGEFDTL